MGKFRKALCAAVAAAMLLQMSAFLPAAAATSAYVSFRDPDLKTYLIDSYGLDVNNDGMISKKELSTLTSLIIYSDNISDLSGLQYATNLKELDIAGAPIGSVPVSILRKIKKLQTLQLSETGIRSIPAGAFSGNRSLKVLWISDNSLRSVQPGAFSGLSQLQTLILSDNGLTSLSSGLFSGLGSLSQLVLSDNGLATLPSSIFSGLSSLATLSLSNNRLLNVAGLFGGLPKLSTLDLSDNDLEKVTAGTFNGVSAVSLAGNGISSVEAGSFDTDAGAAVDLSYNNLSSVAGLAGFAGSLSLDDNLLDLSNAGTAAGIASLSATSKGQDGFSYSGQGIVAAVPGGMRVSNDGSTAQNVTVTASGCDSVTVTRNGAPVAFSSGVIYTVSGFYTITAWRGGKSSTLSFTIDRTKPEIYASAGKGKWTRSNVKVTSSDTIDPFVLRNGNLYWSGSGSSRTYYWSGSTFTQDGRYDLVAYDSAGNYAAYVFYIDKTAPVIAVSSLAGAAVRSGGTAAKGAKIKVVEANMASRTLTRNGKKTAWPVSGKITRPGSYAARVTDKAGNSTKFIFRVK